MRKDYKFNLHEAFLGLVIRLRNDGTFEGIESKVDDELTEKQVEDTLNPKFKQLLDMLDLINKSESNDYDIVSLVEKPAFCYCASKYTGRHAKGAFKDNLLYLKSRHDGYVFHDVKLSALGLFLSSSLPGKLNLFIFLYLMRIYIRIFSPDVQSQVEFLSTLFREAVFLGFEMRDFIFLNSILDTLSDFNEPEFYNIDLSQSIDAWKIDGGYYVRDLPFFLVNHYIHDDEYTSDEIDKFHNFLIRLCFHSIEFGGRERSGIQHSDAESFDKAELDVKFSEYVEAVPKRESSVSLSEVAEFIKAVQFLSHAVEDCSQKDFQLIRKNFIRATNNLFFLEKFIELIDYNVKAYVAQSNHVSTPNIRLINRSVLRYCILELVGTLKAGVELFSGERREQCEALLEKLDLIFTHLMAMNVDHQGLGLFDSKEEKEKFILKLDLSQVSRWRVKSPTESGSAFFSSGNKTDLELKACQAPGSCF